MTIDSYIVKLAVKEAQKSTYRFKVGTVIFDGKKILSVGHNYKLKSVKSYTKSFIKWHGSIHAEVDAILKARRPLKGLSILVVRINNYGQFRNSRPCQECSKYIEYVGIKKIFFSISEWPYIVEKK